MRKIWVFLIMAGLLGIASNATADKAVFAGRGVKDKLADIDRRGGMALGCWLLAVG